jgi:hypothetical protein
MGGSDSNEEQGEAGFSPEEAFLILGNKLRIQILRALWEADDPADHDSSAIAFSDLYQRVGADDSGQFNYHLNKLTGAFVRRTEDGYELREAGYQVIRAVLAGAINKNPSFEPTETAEKCPFCGSVVEVRYEDDRLTVRCTNCEGVVAGEFPPGTYMSFGFPPAGTEGRTPDELLESAHTWYDSMITPMFEGVCPECAGRTTASVEICEDHDPGDGRICDECDAAHEIWVQYVCERCKYARECLVWFELMNHPAVISFYYEHGDIQRNIPFKKLTWESSPYVGDISEEVISKNPLRVRVTIPHEDDELQVTVDEEVNIVELNE